MNNNPNWLYYINSFQFLAWGMTELSPLALVTPENIAKIGSCGVLIPNTEGKIVDLDSGKALGPNQTGELCVKGPQVSCLFHFQHVCE